MLQQTFDAGCLKMAQGDYPEAVRLFREAISLEPRIPELWNNLGISLFEGGGRREALDAFRQAVQLNPRFADALNNLGRALAYCGYREEGLAACRQALQIVPDFPGALENAGLILMECLRFKEALACFDRASSLLPDSAAAWCNRGNALRELGRLDAAAKSYRKAASLAPASILPLQGMVGVYFVAGETEAAIDLLRRALQLEPENAELHSQLIASLTYSHRCSHGEFAAETRLWGAMHGESPLAPAPSKRDFLGRRVRIGYLSADLYRHPVGTFMKEVLKHHDRCAFEITCYQNGTRSDDFTAELREHCDRWFQTTGMSDAQLHDLIVSNGIDILVELSGHTPGNRLKLLAGKPAPVQASWIGFSGSTGLSSVDYLITDETTAPAGDERYYSERLVRLPQCRFCYSPPAPSPFVTDLPAASNGFVTFGSFNNLAKLGEPVIALWARVLLEIPDSRLVLKWKSLAAASVRKRILGLFRAHGVDPGRIECRESSPHFLALAEYNDIDIALDPIPFNGGLTTCEALWMGVPVLTLPGETAISRQSAAFLKTVGLPELIARDEKEYLSLAASLAGDLGRLAQLREGLRDRMAASPLCDGAGFTRDLEEAYRGMLAERASDQESECRPLSGSLASLASGDTAVTESAEREVLLPPERLKLAYLVKSPGGEESAEWLQAVNSHNRERVIPYLYLTGALPEPLKTAALEQGVRLRLVGALEPWLVARLLQREKIDVLVDLQSEGAAGAKLPAGVTPVALGLADLPAPGGDERAIPGPGARAVAMEALYWDRWLDWYLAQEKPRRTRKKGAALAALLLVQQGRELRLAGLLEDACLRLSEAVETDPGNADAYRNLGEVYVYQGRVAEGVAMFRRSIELDPRHLKAHSNLLFALNYRFTGRDAIHSESLAWGKRHGRGSRLVPTIADTGTERPLRVGYLSADFRRHSVGYFFEPLLANHDRAHIESFCYSFFAGEDDTTRRLKGTASGWRDCSALSDQEVARLVREDGIDILVDLAGHTGARILLPILALKPAPVQVTWLGYPNTTGLRALDYRLTDLEVDPEGEDRRYTEKLVRLQGGFLCYLPPSDAPEPAPAPFQERGCVTFGSFNMLPKLSPETIAAWGAVMLRVPDARLVLKSPPFADPRTRDRLWSAFEQLGVSRERITLTGPLATVPEHLAYYREIDLALDTFPYNGTTTTLEALWMGVPVVALEGDRHAGRVAGSLLRRLGLEELVARDPGEYLEKAVALARAPERLLSYRAKLRPLLAGSPLCDGRRFADQVEGAFRAMWRCFIERRRGAEKSKERVHV